MGNLAERCPAANVWILDELVETMPQCHVGRVAGRGVVRDESIHNPMETSASASVLANAHRAIELTAGLMESGLA